MTMSTRAPSSTLANIGDQRFASAAVSLFRLPLGNAGAGLVISFGYLECWMYHWRDVQWRSVLSNGLIPLTISSSLPLAQHDSLEHLGLMERIISFFPRWMIKKSPLRDDYFDR